MKKAILTLSTIILFAAINTTAQTFQIGGGVGYTVAAADLANEVNSMDDRGWNMDGGFNFHAKARVGLLVLTAVGEVGYSMMNSEGEMGSIKYENNLNVLSIKVGPEFHIPLPLIPIDPYVGANLQMNTFSGDIKLQGVPGLPSGTYDMESATRYGLGLNGGAVLSLGGMKLDLNLSYNMLNAFGKEFETSPDPGKFYLDDDEYGSVESTALNTFEAKVTLMFGL